MSPSVLDPLEQLSLEQRPVSEFLRIIHRAQQEASAFGRNPALLPDPIIQRRAERRRAFLAQQGSVWLPAETNTDIHLRVLDLQKYNRKTSSQDLECLVLAERHGWLLLTDDTPLITLAQALNVPTLRTCAALVTISELGLETCLTVASLFNDTIVDELGFYAYKGGQRLWLVCDPPACVWK